MIYAEMFREAYLACSNAMFEMLGIFLGILSTFGALQTVATLVMITIICNRFFKFGEGSDKAHKKKE